MREYGTISSTIWRSEKFKSLPENDSARVLYFYLHTCSHSNSIGCYLLPKGYITTDLSWPESKVDAAINDLSEAGLIRYGYHTDTVFIADFLAHDPIKNPKHGSGAVKMAKLLPDSEEKVCVLREIAKSEHVEQAKIEQIIDTVSIPYAYHNHITSQSHHITSHQNAEEIAKGPRLQKPDREYVFDGETIRLNRKDYDKLVLSYPHLDIDEQLRQLDLELRGKKNWFVEMNSKLNYRNKTPAHHRKSAGEVSYL